MKANITFEKDEVQQSSNQNQNINQSIDYKQLYENERNLRISLQKQLEIQKIKSKKLAIGKPKGKLCPKCLQQINDQSQHQQDLIENFKLFSEKISTMVSHKNVEDYQWQESNLPPPISQNFNNQASIMSNSNDSAPIIENFTVFGLSEDSIHNKNLKNNQQISGEILYSLNEASDIQKQAANFIFPSGVAIKKIKGLKAKDKAIQIMSFCYTNIKSFLLSFKSQNMKFPSQIYEKNDLLSYVNKQKNLFFICIGVRDYTYIDNQGQQIAISLNQLQTNNSANLSEKNIHSEGQKLNNFNNQVNSFKSIDDSTQQIALSQRVFCISSYFPFFSFFQEILRSLINNIKMQRLHIYKLNSQSMNQTIKQTDSNYQLQRMKELFTSTISEICNKKMQFNRSYEIKLINQQKITLLTDWNFAKTYFADDWIFTIMNMFTSESLLDLWTQIILEEGKGVVFICQNSHILTYTVYLFGNILIKPFSYAYPIVNIVPQDEDFLDSPFPVIYGMFKKRKYVEQNQIIQRYNDRTYVFLSPEKVQIRYSAESKKNVQKRKPLKLKNELGSIFKELKSMRRKQSKTMKYQIQNQEFCFLSKFQEREKCVEIIAKINDFIQKQVVQKIPTKLQIEQMNQNMDVKDIPLEKTPQTYLISKVVNNIKKSSKDPFLERFLETQMFSNFVLQENQFL